MRCTTTYKLSKAETFRRGSTMVMGHWGTNMQNPSDDIKKLYKPDPGMVFVQVDQSGADAYCVAYLCPDGNFRQLFKCGIKPHIYVAMHVYAKEWEREGHLYVVDYLKLPIADLPKQEYWKKFAKVISSNVLRYYIGKKCCHSFNYRMRGATFCMNVLKDSEGQVVINKKEGEMFYEMYHGIFPELSQIWWKDIETQLNEDRILRTLQGFPRYFGEAWSEELLRNATAFVPQGTVAIISAQAVSGLRTHIEENNLSWQCLNEMHDSYLAQCPIGESEECTKQMLRFMQQDLVSPRGEKFQMKAAASIGYGNWGSYDEETNPEGMKEIGK